MNYATKTVLLPILLTSLCLANNAIEDNITRSKDISEPELNTPLYPTPSKPLVTSPIARKSANHYGNLCFSRDRDYCMSVLLGLGGYYFNNSPSKSGYGGYLSISSDFFFEWLYVGIDAIFGLGKYTSSFNSILTNEKVDNSFFTYPIYSAFRVGVDFGHFSNVPIFAYIDISSNIRDASFARYINGVFNANVFLGLGVASRIPISQTFRLDMRANLSFSMFENYSGRGIYYVRRGFDGSYRFELMFGAIWSIYSADTLYASSKILDIYTRLRGIYNKDLGAKTNLIFMNNTLNFPKADNFTLMLEFGLGY